MTMRLSESRAMASTFAEGSSIVLCNSSLETSKPFRASSAWRSSTSSKAPEPNTAQVTSLRPNESMEAAMVEPPDCPASTMVSNPRRSFRMSVAVFSTIVSLGLRRPAWLPDEPLTPTRDT